MLLHVPLTRIKTFIRRLETFVNCFSQVSKFVAVLSNSARGVRSTAVSC